MSPLRLIFAGAGEFGLPTLRALVEGGHEVALVVSQPDRPAGRGRTLTATPVAAYAASVGQGGVPVLKTSNINAEPPLPAADAMVVIAFGQKIAPHVIHHPRLGSVNLHASILPKYRGAAPINWAIIRGETTAGNSVIRLAERMDAGAVLGQSSLDIGELETAGELHDRLSAEGAPLILRVLEQLAAGTAVEQPQDESRATLAPKMSREASKLDFTRPAAEVANQIRGMYPWPGCRVRLMSAGTGGEELTRLTLVRARPTSAGVTSPSSPGTILPDLMVGTSNGALSIVEVQPEGKKPMALSAFRNGHRWEAGMRLESI